jgi:hypothetical protein
LSSKETVGDNSRSVLSLSLGNSNVDTLQEFFFLLQDVRRNVVNFILKSVVQKKVASGFFNSDDTFTSFITQFFRDDAIFLDKAGKLILIFLVQFVEFLQIDLGEDDDDGLVGEQGLDSFIEGDLLVNRVTAGFRDIDKVQDTSLKMGQSSDGLHFNVVQLVQRLIQNTGGIDNLPSDVVVISVTNEQ